MRGARLVPGKTAGGFGAKLPPAAYTNLTYAEAAVDKRALSAGDLRYGKGG